MRKFGKQLIPAMREFLRDVKAGKPMKQTIVRRVKVKGETVYTRETFVAPVGEKGRIP
jgi:hypothetical protein